MPLDFYDTSDPGAHDSETAAQARPYVSILFECCHVYARVYRRPDEPVYRGRCPKCLKTAQLRVGPDGTRARFFRAK
jgi:hypothetical protein